MLTALFNLLVFVALLLLVESTNILFSVLLLILVALLFSLYIIGLSSIFVGLLYLAIYVGAVTVFILFVVMMTDLSLSSEAHAADRGRLNQTAISKLELTGPSVVEFVFAIAFVAYLVPRLDYAVTVFSSWTVSTDISRFDFLTATTDNHTMQIALDLMNQHMAPFLILGLIILLSLIGSIFIITQGTRKPLPSIGLSAHFEASSTQQNYSKSQDMDLQLVVDSMSTLTLNSSQNL